MLLWEQFLKCGKCSGSWAEKCAALALRAALLFTVLLPLTIDAQAGAMPANKVATAKPKLAVCKTLASFIEPSVDLVRDT